MKNLTLKSLIVFAFLAVCFGAFAATPQPILRNPFSTNAAGTPVYGVSNISVTNQSQHRWNFYGTNAETVARLFDTTNNTGYIKSLNGQGTNTSIRSSDATSIPFQVRTNLASTNPVFLVNSNGNVGIGTNNPQSKLHVTDLSANSVPGIRISDDVQSFAMRVNGANLDEFQIYDVNDSRLALGVSEVDGAVFVPNGLHSTNAIGTTVLGVNAAVDSQMTNGVATGYAAGYQSTNSYGSVFDGYYAGYQSLNSYSSVFDGYYAGRQSLNSYNSVFDGYTAGYQSSNSYSSVFDGYYAGRQSSNSYNSVFDGYYAGYQSSNSYGSVFDGYTAGYQSLNSYNSVFDGYTAGYLSLNSYNSVFDGYYAGYQSFNSYSSVFDGFAAGYQSSNSYGSVFDGYAAGRQSFNSYSSVFDGSYAGYQSSNSSQCVFLGQYAGTNTVRPKTLLIDTVYKGTNALIYGEFDTGLVRINTNLHVTGNVGIGTIAPASSLHVTNTTLTTQPLRIDAGANANALVVDTNGVALVRAGTVQQPVGLFGFLNQYIQSSSAVLAAAGAHYTNVAGYNNITLNGFTGSTNTGILTNTYAGYYRITCDLTSLGAASQHVEGCILTNGVDSELIGWQKQYSSSNNRKAPQSATGYIYLPALTRISFGIKSTNDTTAITIYKANLTIGTP
jgi:hypothetical protein